MKHIENIRQVFGLPAVVTINRFVSDTDAELELIRAACAGCGAAVTLSEVWEKGGEGGLELGREVLRLIESGVSSFRYAYDDNMSLREKLEAIVTKIYGGPGVIYDAFAERELDKIEAMGFGSLPICVAKTQYSLSDDASKLGRPTDFKITVKKVKVSAGAGFVLAQTGDIMTMPGLPKPPAAERIDINANGDIIGLF